MPKISIIIPALIDTDDKIDWLAECLDSVKVQTLVDFEAIIVDDASPKTLDDVRRRFADDPRFHFVRCPAREGVAKCRNTAAALATAAALLPLDSDDRLASPAALAQLYAEWDRDRGKIIYGDLQRLAHDGSGWREGKIIRLSDYTFDRTLDLRGTIPVTAMHSRDAWEQAGGWKARYNAGLEDVEYWINLGELGYCGRKIEALILQYRKHDTSRTHSVRHVETIDGRPADEVMRQRITEDHKDVFQGRYPMGCCGSRGNSSPQNGGGEPVQMMSINSFAPNRTLAENDLLPDVDAQSKMWVQYVGRMSDFTIRGRATGLHYRIKGNGHVREVHMSDIPQFQGKREGGSRMAFKVAVPPPMEYLPPAVVIEDTPAPPTRRSAPEMATIERREAAPIPVVSITAPPTRQAEPVQDYDLSKLKLTERIAPRYKPDEIHRMLEAESWTLQALAAATETDLTAYPGIGKSIARTIIDAAKENL